MNKRVAALAAVVCFGILSAVLYLCVPRDMTGKPYAEIEAYMLAHPRLPVTYTVTIDGGTEPVMLKEDAAELTLTAQPQLDSLLAQTEYLQSLTTVDVRAVTPTMAQLTRLQGLLPKAEVVYDSFTYAGTAYDLDTETVDLTPLTHEDMTDAQTLLSLLPKVREVTLPEGLSLDDAYSLYTGCPEPIYHYSTQLFGQVLTTDMERVEYFKVDIGDEGLEQFRKLLPMMHKLTYFKLDWCGTSNEAMAQLRDDYADQFKVVWRVFMNWFNCLTDTYKVWVTYGLNNETASVLKYCTEVRYLDIGHNLDVSNIDFVSYMPKLQVCIIAECLHVTDITPLRNCKDLELLELFLTDVTDLSVLSELTNLKHLNLSCMDITDLSPLYALPGLERVWTIGSPGITWDKVVAFQEQQPKCWIQRYGEHSTDAGWRFLDEDETVLHKRYALLRKQIGYGTWDISQYPKGYVTKEIQ